MQASGTKIMKSLTVIAFSLLVCSCADMVVTKTYVPNSGASAGPVDAKGRECLQIRLDAGSAA